MHAGGLGFEHVKQSLKPRTKNAAPCSIRSSRNPETTGYCKSVLTQPLNRAGVPITRRYTGRLPCSRMLFHSKNRKKDIQKHMMLQVVRDPKNNCILRTALKRTKMRVGYVEGRITNAKISKGLEQNTRKGPSEFHGHFFSPREHAKYVLVVSNELR
jgi:hypothetical protein